VKSKVIPDEPGLKGRDSEAGDCDTEHCECEVKDGNSCCETCLASGMEPLEQEAMAEAGARPLLSAEMKAEILEYVQAFAVAIVLAAFIITFIAQSFVVEGSSMEPSLHNRERLLLQY
jgi:hypothetical protein